MTGPTVRVRFVGASACVLVGIALLTSATWAASVLPAPNVEPPTERQRIQVGPTRAVKSVNVAAILAGDGAVVEVDAGNYFGDTAVWSQKDVTLRAVGGRVRLIANGRSAESKGIWVVRTERMTVEGFDFLDAAVRDRNGAGIRLERGHLQVRNCRFMYNENGILTGNQPGTVLEVEDSEFGHNGAGDGYSHNLYAGSIARLTVTGSYFHHARRGHLLKSRAATNYVAYNRLTDGSDGNASYELEFPDGGVAYVIGNIIQQSSKTENPHLISVGAEGYKWPANEFYLINNTLVDDRPRNGVFLRVSPGAATVVVLNNLLIGVGRWSVGGAANLRNNPTAAASDFVNLGAGDFRLRPPTRPREQAADPGTANGVSLRPSREYRHPRHSVALDGPPIQPGAVQSLATGP